MSRNSLVAACFAALLMACTGPGAWADENRPSASNWLDPFDSRGFSDAIFDGALVAGPWTLRPVAGIHTNPSGAFGQLPGLGRTSDTLTASLGFQGAAKVDSRVGTIYSRLSLSFEHEFRANPHRVITGSPAARRTGFYGDRSEVDVMTADAVFAMQMSEWTFGYVEYGTEMEPGGGADHQVALRFRFTF